MIIIQRHCKYSAILCLRKKKLSLERSIKQSTCACLQRLISAREYVHFQFSQQKGKSKWQFLVCFIQSQQILFPVHCGQQSVMLHETMHLPKHPVFCPLEGNHQPFRDLTSPSPLMMEETALSSGHVTIVLPKKVRLRVRQACSDHKPPPLAHISSILL